jgi:hypothetical protein
MKRVAAAVALVAGIAFSASGADHGIVKPKPDPGTKMLQPPASSTLKLQPKHLELMTLGQPRTELFARPMASAYTRIDWCLTWATDCGQPAADAFCRMKGFDKAASFNRLANVPPTITLRDARTCDAPGCDAIADVTCAKYPRTFDRPMYAENYRADWCVNFGQECGKPAADRFCKYKGYSSATAFAILEDVPPTWVPGNGGGGCLQPGCDALADVTCAP